MKNSVTIIIIVLSFFIKAKGQSNSSEVDSIKLYITEELKNTAHIFKNQLTEMLDYIENTELLFPYINYDSVVFVSFKNIDNLEPVEFNMKYRDYTFSSQKLDTIAIEQTLKLLNNPSNYNWGECGTPLFNYEIQFFKEGEIKSSFSIACDGYQIYCSPKNPLIKYGNLHSEARNKLFMYLPMNQ